MSYFRYMVASIVLISAALAAVPAEAVFHLWFIQEIYSNHDGTVQFIELRATANSQDELMGHTVTTNSNTFTFNADRGTNSTNTRSMLLATAGFGSLPGAVAPDYPTIPLPPNFFSPAGDTINFGEGSDIKTFTSLPTNGISSFNYAGYFGVPATTANNTPRNFANQTGQVNLPPPPATNGDYNDDGFVDAADYVLWRKTLNSPASPSGSGADGDSDGTVDPGDYDFWLARFGTTIDGSGGGGTAIPEPASCLGLIVVWAMWQSGCRRRR